MFKGYYKLEHETKEALVGGEWLRTGDVGLLLPRTNALKLIDRKKNIFKLSQGEYIAPEKLENVYKLFSKNIDDFYVYGDSYKSCIVALIYVK